MVASNRRLEPQPFAMEWGYHLFDGKRIINARSETASQKAMFADGIRQRRCLIPVQHYYEWEKADDRKVKYAIEPEGAEGFYLAGIYRMEAGKPVFTILTRNAAEGIDFIHERMPVILPNEAAEDWLNLKYHGMEKTGVHSLRHTFASTLFAKKADIKTISKLLGHANIQITLDTYIHLFENIDHDAVAQLDDEF